MAGNLTDEEAVEVGSTVAALIGLGIEGVELGLALDEHGVEHGNLVAAFDRVARGGPPERVEFSERVPTERWFAAWFARHRRQPPTG